MEKIHNLQGEKMYLARVAESVLVTAIDEFRALPFHAKRLMRFDAVLNELQTAYRAITGQEYQWQTPEDVVTLRNLARYG